MLTISLTFLTGRYHATDSAHHVNEGVVDWPPSPWRICRSLIATWFFKAQDVAAESVLRSLVIKLSEKLPCYRLPDAVGGHSRHYMPTIIGSKESKTKIFDTFVHVAPEQAIEVFWDVDLSSEEKQLLDYLLINMNYFGRAESLVDARLSENGDVPQANANPVLIGTDSTEAKEKDKNETEIIRVLAPMLPFAFQEWLKSQKPEVDATAKKPKAKRKKRVIDDITDIYDAMLVETAALKNEGWNQAIGSRWVEYARLSKAFGKRIQNKKKSNSQQAEAVTVARFAIFSKVAPGITEALSLGERVHQALVKISDGNRVFTGCDDNGKKLESNEHRHAYILSEASEPRAEVKFISVFAKGGFDSDAQRALQDLRKTWDYDGRIVQFVLLGMGKEEDFCSEKMNGANIFGTSKRWVSHTPFVPTRHQKKKPGAFGFSQGSPEDDLLRLLKLERMLSEEIILSAKVKRLEKVCVGMRKIPCLKFQRIRQLGDGASAGNMGYAFEIEFKEPVSGPIAVGYGSHFGLGLFVPKVE